MANIKIKGLTVQDIIQMTSDQLESYSTQDLKRIATRLNSAVNKRIKRASGRKGIVKHNLRYASETGQRFSVKGAKTKAQAEKLILQAQRFYLESKVTKRDSEEYKRKVELRLGGEFYDEDEERLFWETYKRYKELDAGKRVGKGASSEEAQKYIYKRIHNDGASESNIFRGLSNKLNAFNRKIEHERQQAESGVNPFDEIEPI